ncbi:hypothetical protein A4X03_0g6394 [Tilletia caries]|uniref:Uncharacterized protein n=1 Tax=Tilletia caries TaxID=13290 RepID=A0A8T8T0Y7_9BASI|nr:hypothetical protein A4X03_0g6394 [Tilletia caries]
MPRWTGELCDASLAGAAWCSRNDSSEQRNLSERPGSEIAFVCVLVRHHLVLYILPLEKGRFVLPHQQWTKQASKANKHLEEAKKKIAADHAEIDSLKKRLASSDRCIRDFQGLAEREEGIRERERQLDEREAGAR